MLPKSLPLRERLFGEAGDMSGSLDAQSEALLFRNGVSSAAEVDTSLSAEETGNGTLEVG